MSAQPEPHGAHQVWLACHEVPHARIHAGGPHPDEHLVVTDRGPVDITQLQHVGRAVRVLNDGPHCVTSVSRVLELAAPGNEPNHAPTSARKSRGLPLAAVSVLETATDQGSYGHCMRFEATIGVSAPPERVFDVYSDVERWPDWTQSVTSVERLDHGPLQVGSRARVKQPRLPVAVWEVTELVPGRSFTWVARGPGIVTTGSHAVTREANGERVKVTASLEQGGVLGPLLGLLTKRLTNRYLDIEVRGLKAHCER